jgi:hypothetical protein
MEDPIMIRYNAIFEWDGWGGAMRLGSGKCHLRLIDLHQDRSRNFRVFKPFIVIVNSLEGSTMSVRSCAGHIATRVCERFDIDPARMLYVEYTPETRYGASGEHIIASRMESVEFEWREGKAIQPVWREIRPPMDEIIRQWIGECDSNSAPPADKA